MCGRYKIVLTPKDLDGFYILLDEIYRKNIDDGFLDPFMHRELTPGSVIPVLTEDDPISMKWGFSMDKKLLINGRSETVSEKPMFRELLGSKRCLIPSSHYFEWGGKNKYEISTRSPFFFMAGLYRSEITPDGNMKNRALILTTSPNDDIKRIHDRMPVILSEADAKRYIERSTGLSDILPFFRPWGGKLNMNISGNEQLSFF